MTTNRFELRHTGRMEPDVFLDGERLECVKSYRLTQNVGELAEVVLELAVTEAPSFDAPTRVYLTHGVARALIALGWTPPEDES